MAPRSFAILVMAAASSWTSASAADGDVLSLKRFAVPADSLVAGSVTASHTIEKKFCQDLGGRLPTFNEICPPKDGQTYPDITGKDCALYDQSSGWKVVMGDNIDYFKPKSGETLCSALKSIDKFLWSATEDGNYVAPASADLSWGHSGGSAHDWPKNNVAGDDRAYLPFWGKNGEVYAGINGCCHYTKSDAAVWGRKFKIYLVPTRAPRLGCTSDFSWMPYNDAGSNSWVFVSCDDPHTDVCRNHNTYYGFQPGWPNDAYGAHVDCMVPPAPVQWFVGDEEQSCSQVCADKGAECSGSELRAIVDKRISSAASATARFGIADLTCSKATSSIAPEETLLKQNYKCPEGSARLFAKQRVGSVSDCAAKCADNPGCKYFSFSSTAKKCMGCSSNTPTAWDKYDFYEMPGAISPFISKSYQDITGKDCAQFDQSNGWKVVMGENTDYYKPKPGETLCSALKSVDKFLWSATEDGNYVAPASADLSWGRTGGSGYWFPRNNVAGDNRDYLPFWSSTAGNVDPGTNGCCHYTKSDAHAWGRAFKIYLVPTGVSPSNDYLASSDCRMFPEGPEGPEDDEITGKGCAQFDQSNGWKVVMGENTDYYKPKPGETLCSALKSVDKFLWSATEDGNYVAPASADLSWGRTGGSGVWWPRDNVAGDNRDYLPFWSSTAGNVDPGTNGCCHYTKSDAQAWGRAFKIYVVRAASTCAAVPRGQARRICPCGISPSGAKLRVDINAEAANPFRDAASGYEYTAGGYTSAGAITHQGVKCLDVEYMERKSEVNLNAKRCGPLFGNAKCAGETYPDITGKDCAQFDQSSGWKVVMGENTDYFKPKPGETLCSALKSIDKFLWSATEDGNYVAPASAYLSWGRTGGSAHDWPKNNVAGDDRAYLPFWSYTAGNVAPGTNGCCHYTKSDAAVWGRTFKIYLTKSQFKTSSNNVPEFCNEGTGWCGSTSAQASTAFDYVPQTVAQSYTQVYWVNWRVSDVGWRTLFRVTNDRAAVVHKGVQGVGNLDGEELGMYGQNDAFTPSAAGVHAFDYVPAFRSTGTRIAKHRWEFLVVTGQQSIAAVQTYPDITGKDCALYDQLSGFKVVMGENTDYYRPKRGETLCSALKSSTNAPKWLWSATEDGTYVGTGTYWDATLVGGSEEHWPKNNVAGDDRNYLPFWGKNGEVYAGTNGCCHSTKSDAARWGKAFKIHLVLPTRTSREGTQNYYLASCPNGACVTPSLDAVGTTDGVVTGQSPWRVGMPGQGPGHVARSMLFDGVLTAEQMLNVYRMTRPSGLGGRIRPPTCHVDSEGRTHIKYNSKSSPSFKCAHENGECACKFVPPREDGKVCKQFGSNLANGKVINAGSVGGCDPS